MKTTPSLWDADRLKQHLNEVGVRVEPVNSRDDGIRALRPISSEGLYLKKRLHLAWKVFTGEADAVIWKH